MPKYLPNGYFVCIFQKDMFKVNGDKIRLSFGRNFAKKFGVRFLEFKLPPTVILISEIDLKHKRYIEFTYFELNFRTKKSI